LIQLIASVSHEREAASPICAPSSERGITTEVSLGSVVIGRYYSLPLSIKPQQTLSMITDESAPALNQHS
jgi:hypothetical protein